MGLFKSMEDVLKKTADAILQEPINVSFHRKVTGYKAILALIGLYKTKVEYSITPLSLGTSMRISRELLTIPEDVFNADKFLTSGYNAFDKHAEVVANCVALSIANNKKGPSNRLKSELLENLTPGEVLTVFKAVFAQMDLQVFMTTIISIRGTNILKETSQQNQGS